MDIKEIAEQVSKMIYVEDGLLLSKFISEKFAKALIAEIAKQNEPVEFWLCEGCGHYYNLPVSSCDCMADIPLKRTVFYAVPPTAEQIANETAWQPIETAPKDGTFILCFVDAYMKPMVLFWDSPYWREPANMLGLKKQPTHWMPLPKAPANGASS